METDAQQIEKGVREEAAASDLRQTANGGGDTHKVKPLGVVMGLTPDEVLQQWWRENEADPNFFKQLRIAKDGGLTEVTRLFETSRFLWAALSLLSLLLNVTFILWASIDALVRDKWIVPKTGKFLLINEVLLGHVGDKELRTEVCLALLELTVLVFLIAKGIWEVCRSVYYSRRADPAYGWYALAHFFFEVVPDISTYSALRMLSAVTPAIFIPALNRQIAGVTRRGGKYCGLPLWCFLVRRILIGCIGFDAFMVKFQEVSVYANATSGSKADILYNSLAFLNQMLGVVQVNRYVRQRLMIYIFGGEDGWISPAERTRQEAWYGMLAQSIWRESKTKALPFLWFVAVMLSYSDSDFQRLTLNERKRQDQLAAADAEASLKPAGGKLGQVHPFDEPTN